MSGVGSTSDGATPFSNGEKLEQLFSRPFKLLCIMLMFVIMSSMTAVRVAYIPCICILIYLCTSNVKFSRKTLFWLASLPIIVILKLVFHNDEFLIPLHGLQYFFGYLIFLLVMSKISKTSDDDLIFIALILGLITISDTILINLFGRLAWMSNYPDITTVLSHKTTFFGWFQRSYSFGTNASITGVAHASLVVALLLQSQRSKIWLSALSVNLISILCSFSGAAIISLIFGFLLIVPKKFVMPILLAFIGLLFVSGTIATHNRDISYRVSVDYLLYLINFKSAQISDVVLNTDFDLTKLFFGKDFERYDPLPFGDDFGWAILLNTFGLSGLFLYFVIFISVSSSGSFQSLAPIIVLLIGSFHYGAIFAPIGQFLAAFYLLAPAKYRKFNLRIGLPSRMS